MVRIPPEEDEDCPSGFVTVKLRDPLAAPPLTVTLSVSWVGLSQAMEFTVTPPIQVSTNRQFTYREPLK
jgi:hypothetical protein